MKMVVARACLLVAVVCLACPRLAPAGSANLLRASRDSQVIQNKRADADDLSGRDDDSDDDRDDDSDDRDDDD